MAVNASSVRGRDLNYRAWFKTLFILNLPFTLLVQLFKGFHMSEILDEKVRVVYEDGVFKPLQEIELREGTVALVLLKPGRITNAARRFRIKVDEDVMKEFVEERR